MARYKAQGWRGTAGRKQLQADLEAMRKEKEQKLEKKVAAKQKQIRQKAKPRKISKAEVEAAAGPHRTPRMREIRRLQAKADQMKEKAREVAKDHPKAAATYRKAAREYLKQAAAQRAKR